MQFEKLNTVKVFYNDEFINYILNCTFHSLYFNNTFDFDSETNVSAMINSIIARLWTAKY